MNKINISRLPKIIIGADHRGFKLKEKIKLFLKAKGFAVEDKGTCSEEPCDYPKIAFKVGLGVVRAKNSRGILICKTGIGDSIAANKVKGVRAALCYNMKAARLSRQHNDANVLVLGSDFVREKLAKEIIETWLKIEFEGGRHLRRINQIKRFEEKRCL
ncbi:MAG: ribose 5-phosphate isomerase B [Candidatus Omnitrophota bacterium]|nr:ribose 5-phosphate isomerase B [Candidatus Omnitrophota bacterium]